MKLIIALLLSSFSLLAADVDGKLFYLLPSGEFAVRDVTLTVPPRGQGDVILSGQNFSVTASNFETKRAHGQVIFEATFPMTFMGQTSDLFLTGTYMRSASGEVMYWGDHYKLKNGTITHNGGFKFTNR